MKLNAVLAAVILLLVGVLMVFGILDFMLRIIGVLCLLAGGGLLVSELMSRKRRPWNLS